MLQREVAEGPMRGLPDTYERSLIQGLSANIRGEAPYQGPVIES